MEALRECVRMITANAGGCTTPFPFEAAIWLLEEQEELYGGAIPIYKSVRGPMMKRVGVINRSGAPCTKMQICSPWSFSRLTITFLKKDGDM